MSPNKFTRARQSLNNRIVELRTLGVEIVISDLYRVEFRLPFAPDKLLVWEYRESDTYYWYVESLDPNGKRISQQVNLYRSYQAALLPLTPDTRSEIYNKPGPDGTIPNTLGFFDR